MRQIKKYIIVNIKSHEVIPDMFRNILAARQYIQTDLCDDKRAARNMGWRIKYATITY